MAKNLYFIIIFCTLAVLMPVIVYAGEWKQNDYGWWWQNDDGSYPVSCWEWLDGNGDGVYECYYFDKRGYMATDKDVSDGSHINSDGARIYKGEIQTRRVTADVINRMEVEKQILILINQERQSHGLSQLAKQEELRDNAEVRAREQAEIFGHTRPDGSLFHTALTVNYVQAGENICYTHVVNRTTEGEIAQLAVSNWLASEAHRKNILALDWKETAIAVYIEGDQVYIVQLFMTPGESPDAQ